MSDDRDPAPPDVAAGLRFVHLVEVQTKARVAEVSATLIALLESLVAEGVLPIETYEKKKRLALLREERRAEGEAAVAVADIPDKYAVPSPPIDCAARLALCRARCCTLDFALSVQDLDERVARWDYGRPYRLQQRDDGLCVHNEGGLCSIHAARPGMCRAYDCREDRRIWIDFERRIPAP